MLMCGASYNALLQYLWAVFLGNVLALWHLIRYPCAVTLLLYPGTLARYAFCGALVRCACAVRLCDALVRCACAVRLYGAALVRWPCAVSLRVL